MHIYALQHTFYVKMCGYLIDLSYLCADYGYYKKTKMHDTF